MNPFHISIDAGWKVYRSNVQPLAWTACWLFRNAAIEFVTWFGLKIYDFKKHPRRFRQNIIIGTPRENSRMSENQWLEDDPFLLKIGTLLRGTNSFGRTTTEERSCHFPLEAGYSGWDWERNTNLMSPQKGPRKVDLLGVVEMLR